MQIYHLSYINIQIQKGRNVFLKTQMFLHIPGLGYDGLVGYSPIAMTKNAIGLSITAEEYGSKFFANSANTSGVLEHTCVLKGSKKLREVGIGVLGAVCFKLL